MFWRFLKILGGRIGFKYCFEQLKEIIHAFLLILACCVPLQIIGVILFRWIFKIPFVVELVNNTKLGSVWYNPTYLYLALCFLGMCWLLVGLIIVIIKLFRFVKDCWNSAKV